MKQATDNAAIPHNNASSEMDSWCHIFSTQNQNAHTDLLHNILMETDEMRKTKKDRSRKKTRVNKQTHYPATLFSSANQEIQKTYSVAAVALSLFSTISVALVAFISAAASAFSDAFTALFV